MDPPQNKANDNTRIVDERCQDRRGRREVPVSEGQQEALSVKNPPCFSVWHRRAARPGLQSPRLRQQLWGRKIESKKMKIHKGIGRVSAPALGGRPSVSVRFKNSVSVHMPRDLVRTYCARVKKSISIAEPITHSTSSVATVCCF